MPCLVASIYSAAILSFDWVGNDMSGSEKDSATAYKEACAEASEDVLAGNLGDNGNNALPEKGSDTPTELWVLDN
jgi:hypothetical protein